MSRSAHSPFLRAKGLGKTLADINTAMENVMKNRILTTTLDIGPPDGGHTHVETQGSEEYSYNFDVDVAGAVLIDGTRYEVAASTDNVAVSSDSDSPPIGATNDNIVVAIYAYVSSGSIAYAGVLGTAKETATLAWAARPTDEDIAEDADTMNFVRLADMLVIRDGATAASSDTAADADFDKTSCYDVSFD